MKDYIEEFKFEDQVLQVRLSGNFPDDLLRKQGNVFQPLIDACATNKCRKALIDARELSVGLNTFQMFDAGENAVIFEQLSLRVALVARDDMIDPFFENVVSNRGGKIGVFTDKEKALAWLGK